MQTAEEFIETVSNENGDEVYRYEEGVQGTVSSEDIEARDTAIRLDERRKTLEEAAKAMCGLCADRGMAQRITKALNHLTHRSVLDGRMDPCVC